MKKNIFFITFILLITTISSKSQIYIRRDSAISYLNKIVDQIDAENSVRCIVKTGEKLTIYTPDEISEYKLEDSRVYVSREIIYNGEPRKFFLERLVDDSISLYYLKTRTKKMFFVEKETDTLIYITCNNKKEFQKQLIQVTADCNNTKIAINHIKPHKKKMQKFISLYNNCFAKPFPYMNINIYMGISNSKIYCNQNKVENIKNKILKADDIGVTYGISVDKPINMSYFYWHTQINYSQTNFYTYSNNIDMFINLRSVTIPLSIKYVYPARKIRPFGYLGAVYLHNINYSHTAYSSYSVNNSVYFDNLNIKNLLPTSEFGYTVGLGMLHFANKNNRLFYEFRINQLFNNIVDDYYNHREYYFVIGYSF